MLRTSKRKVTALLCAASALCVTGATLALTNEAVKVEAAEATYGYNVQFQDDFNDGQLKEGWEYVYGGIKDGAVTWGLNQTPEQGKMLYNTGTTEYAYSVDITMGTMENTKNPNVHMPILVVDPQIPTANIGSATDTWRVTEGVSINFQASQIQLWDFQAGKAITSSTATYGNVVKFGVEQTWTVVVGANIEIYVDGAYLVGVATPSYYTSNDCTSFYCGIGSGKIATATAYDTTFAYDDFTVWTKNSANTATSSLYDFSKIIEDQTVTAEGDTDGTPLISATTSLEGTQFVLSSTVTTESDSDGKAYTGSSHWLGTETFTDFTMTIKVDSVWLPSYSGIYFGTTETDGKVSGYRLAFGNGNGEGAGTKYRLYKVTDETDSTTTNPSVIMGNSNSFELDNVLILSVKGKVISLTYTIAGETTVQTDTYTADDDISGCVGVRLKDASSTTTYNATFSMAVSALSTESADALTKATVNSVTDSTKRVYSVRKNTTMGLDSWSANAVAFVGENNALRSTLAIGDTAVEANILALDGFGLRDGASVRLPVSNDDDTKSGIRFTAELAKAEYAALADYGIDVSELGMLIMKQEMSEAFTLTTANVKKAVTDKIAEVNGSGTYIYRATLTGIPNTDYETKISARGYITLTLTIDGEETTKTIYTAYDVANNSRSIQEVAIAAETEVKATFQNGDVAYEQWEAYVAGNAQ